MTKARTPGIYVAAARMSPEECRRRYGTDTHPHAGKWRCAKCNRIYAPPAIKRKTKGSSLPQCPSCREAEDVFPADDGGWERAEEERKGVVDDWIEE